jgi:hypothetical protein
MGSSVAKAIDPKKKGFNVNAGTGQCVLMLTVIFSILSQLAGCLRLRQTIYVSPMAEPPLKTYTRMCKFQWGIIIPWNKTRNMLFMEPLQVALTIASLFNPMNGLCASCKRTPLNTIMMRMNDQPPLTTISPNSRGLNSTTITPPTMIQLRPIPKWNAEPSRLGKERASVTAVLAAVATLKIANPSRALSEDSVAVCLVRWMPTW